MVELPNVPLTRQEQYLSAIAGAGANIPQKPLTRTEQYLAYIAENGGAGSGGGASGDGGIRISSDGRKLIAQNGSDVTESVADILYSYLQKKIVAVVGDKQDEVDDDA